MARRERATGSGQPRPPRTVRPGALSEPPTADTRGEVDADLTAADRAFLDYVAEAAVTLYLARRGSYR